MILALAGLISLTKLWTQMGQTGCSWYVNHPRRRTFANACCKGNLFDQHIDTTSTSSGSNTTYSPSCLSQLNHNFSPISSALADTFYFDPSASNNDPSSDNWRLPAMPNPLDNCDWPYSQQLPTNNLYGFNRGAPSRSQSISTDQSVCLYEAADTAYEKWESSPNRHQLGASDQVSYTSIPDELNQMDAAILVNSVASSAIPPHARSYPPHSTKRTRRQSLHNDSYDSTSLSPVVEATLLPSPVSNDDRRLVAPKSAMARKRHPFKRSPIRIKIPHSAIEKRYRSNLNTKMIELQQCVPALRVKINNEDDSGSPDPSTGSPKQDRKLPKGLILENAADYIRTLEARTSELDTHVELLERRLVVLQRIALEKLKGADLGLMAADRRNRESPGTSKSSANPKALPSAKTRASKSLKAISRQREFDAGSNGSLSKVEKEHSGNDVIENVSPPQKCRRMSRNTIVQVNLVQLKTSLV